MCVLCVTLMLTFVSVLFECPCGVVCSTLSGGMIFDVLFETCSWVWELQLSFQDVIFLPYRANVYIIFVKTPGTVTCLKPVVLGKQCSCT